MVPPFPSCRVPELIVVGPAYVLLPVRVVWPAPACVSEPVPEIVPENVIASERLYTRAQLSTMLVGTIEPVVTPLPSCNVPELIVVAPV